MDRLYIIGNGFDIDLGMRTRYKDFLESSDFSALTNKDSAEPTRVFANYLLNKQKENWIDLETALKNYVTETSGLYPEEFHIVYDEIKTTLKNYLNKQEAKFIGSINETGGYFGSSNAISLIKKIKTEVKNNNSIKIINFNYTSRAFAKIINRVEVTNNQNLIKIVHIHGTLDVQSGIVLGVEDSALSQEKAHFEFIKKGRDVNFSNSDMFNSYNKASEISIFGHSLGESDIMHFKPMFEHIFQERKSHNITINFYNNGDLNYLNERIDRLVNGNIGQFKGICNLRFNPYIDF